MPNEKSDLLTAITEALNRIKQLTRPHSGPWIVAEETLERISTHTTEIQSASKMSQQDKSSIAVFQSPDMSCHIAIDVLMEAVNRALGLGAKIILIDLSDVSRLDSLALGCLMTIYYKTLSMNRELYLCSVCEQAKRLIGLTGTTDIFQIFDDRNAFERFISEQTTDSE